MKRIILVITISLVFLFSGGVVKTFGESYSFFSTTGYNGIGLTRFDNTSGPSYLISQLSNTSVAWDGLAFDRDGHLYVSSWNGDLITVNQITGEKQYIGSSEIALSGDIAFDNTGRLFRFSGSQLYEVDPHNASSTFVAQFQANIVGFDFDLSQSRFLALSSDSTLYSLKPNDTSLILLGNLGEDNVGKDLHSIAVKDDGSVFVSSTNGYFYQVDMETITKTYLGHPTRSEVRAIAYGPTTPEPATLLLLTFGGLILRKRKA